MELRGAIDQENTNLGQNTQKSFLHYLGEQVLKYWKKLKKVEKS